MTETSVRNYNHGNDVHHFFALGVYMTLSLISYAAQHTMIHDSLPKYPSDSNQSNLHFL